MGGHLDFARNKLHIRNTGAVVNLRATQAGHDVLDLADFAEEKPGRPTQEKMALMMSQCAVNNLGQPAPPEAASSNSSEVKCWLTARRTSHA